MACNCKADTKARNIRASIAEEVEEISENKVIRFFATIWEYILVAIKMGIVCLGVILVTPFITMFVLYGFVFKGNVTLKVPKILRENIDEE